MTDDAPLKTASGVNDLSAFWMPFTPNRQFKAAPRMIDGASGMYYHTPDGRQVLDATAGLWCVNAGHCRPSIVAAIQAQAAELDYAPPFQFAHPAAFTLARRLAAMAPGDLEHVFFCNSGSEAVDTALKIAIAYHRMRGEGARIRLIGRERAYHGVGFGGISVGGMVNNRKHFGPLLAGVDHLPHTYSREQQPFANGQPVWGAHLADDLERLVALHDASTIAAVIIEPMAGSTGVLPPPVGYLQRLRQICDRHGILLIFDEVITGFGRLGAAFAAGRFGVVPDLLCFAKGVSNAAAPLGGVLARASVYDAFMQGPDHVAELMHGYTYSAHPMGVAAAHAALDLYAEEDLFARALALEPAWARAIQGLRGAPFVLDIRTIGLAAGIDLAPIDGAPGKRGFDVMRGAFHTQDLMVRVSGDTIALSPPLIISEAEIGMIAGRFRSVLESLG
jgi:beta-alanine--pyruvate transaminase